METAFGWLGQIFDALLQFVPRITIVRNTHAAVKWKPFGKVVAIEGGRRTFYWPLVTEIDQIVVARQTDTLPPQVLTTKDGKAVAVGAFMVYRISDVVKAIGEKNWDVESTVRDITMASITEEVASRGLNQILDTMSGEGNFHEILTSNCRKQLRQFGVYVERVGLTDFAECKVHKVFGVASQLPLGEES